MSKFRIVSELSGYREYEVEAENKDEAEAKYVREPEKAELVYEEFPTAYMGEVEKMDE